MFHPRKIAGAVALALGLVGAAHATGNPTPTFSNVIAFGDSLSDAGNISLSIDPSIQPPQEFTTNPGAVVVQNVAAALGHPLTASAAGGNDYAWGGAGIYNNSPGTPAGVPPDQHPDQHLSGQRSHANADALYTMWGGANDIFYASHRRRRSRADADRRGRTGRSEAAPRNAGRRREKYSSVQPAQYRRDA